MLLLVTTGSVTLPSGPAPFCHQPPAHRGSSPAYDTGGHSWGEQALAVPGRRVEHPEVWDEHQAHSTADQAWQHNKENASVSLFRRSWRESNGGGIDAASHSGWR